MDLKAKLEISCSSTTFIKKVFVVNEQIRNYNIVMLHCQSTMAVSETASTRGVVAVAWWQHVGVGPASQAEVYT